MARALTARAVGSSDTRHASQEEEAEAARVRESLAEEFPMLDVNGNGVLEKSEIEADMVDGPELMQSFTLADANKDGVLVG
jgi:hypothetical protein